MRHGERNVTHIVSTTKQTHPNVSKHLWQLREAGVVVKRREGQQIFYRVADPVVERVCRLVCESLQKTYQEESGETSSC